MNPNVLPSERCGIVGVIDPDANAAGTVTTGWIKFANWLALMAVVMAGDLGVNATIDAKFQQATDAAGTGAKDVAGKAITQMTQAGASDNKQAIINLRPEELDVNGGFCYVRLSYTTATATSDGGAIVLGFSPTNTPVADIDLASVAQIV